MKMSLYLIGQITADPITYEWRRELRDHVETLPTGLKEEIHLIDPCNNSFSMNMLREATHENVEFAENVVKNHQAKLFPAIDKRYVKKESTGSIFNANHFTPETPFIGTIFELAWYHDHPWKPVVGVFDGDMTKDYLCQHPFVQDTVHTWVKTPLEALMLLISLQHK